MKVWLKCSLHSSMEKMKAYTHTCMFHVFHMECYERIFYGKYAQPTLSCVAIVVVVACASAVMYAFNTICQRTNLHNESIGKLECHICKNAYTILSNKPKNNRTHTHAHSWHTQAHNTNMLCCWLHHATLHKSIYLFVYDLYYFPHMIHLHVRFNTLCDTPLAHVYPFSHLFALFRFTNSKYWASQRFNEALRRNIIQNIQCFNEIFHFNFSVCLEMVWEALSLAN